MNEIFKKGQQVFLEIKKYGNLRAIQCTQDRYLVSWPFASKHCLLNLDYLPCHIVTGSYVADDHVSLLPILVDDNLPQSSSPLDYALVDIVLGRPPQNEKQLRDMLYTDRDITTSTRIQDVFGVVFLKRIENVKITRSYDKEVILFCQPARITSAFEHSSIKAGMAKDDVKILREL